jgi:FKBP-type peptidyl-prolyl cis-trans isomerase FkpA
MRYDGVMQQKTFIIGLVGAGAIVSLALLLGPSASQAPEARDETTSKASSTLPVLPTSSTPSMTQAIPGLTIDILTPGSGASITKGQVAVVDYTGTLTDGTVFDSSIPRGQPFSVNLGRGEVIQGWDLGIVGMQVGEVRRLTIAPEMGYGASGFPGVIPPNATLIFEVTLRAIQ